MFTSLFFLPELCIWLSITHQLCVLPFFLFFNTVFHSKSVYLILILYIYIYLYPYIFYFYTFNLLHLSFSLSFFFFHEVCILIYFFLLFHSFLFYLKIIFFYTITLILYSDLIYGRVGMGTEGLFSEKILFSFFLLNGRPWNF